LNSSVDLLVSPTEDAGKILASLARVKIGKVCEFSTALQVAQLALKHRKNKNGSQRIVTFVGSPIQEEMPILQKIAKQLKKNNVAVDVINLGEIDVNNDKLLEFIKCVNSNENR
jgi:26S proteasome regulatory subunit N10